MIEKPRVLNEHGQVIDPEVAEKMADNEDHFRKYGASQSHIDHWHNQSIELAEYSKMMEYKKAKINEIMGSLEGLISKEDFAILNEYVERGKKTWGKQLSTGSIVE